MNSIFKGCFVASCFALMVGCNQNKVADLDNSELRANAESLEQVRLHFTNFRKSKSGATWMGWPDDVRKALEGLKGIQKIESDAERDDMVFTIDTSILTRQQLLDAIGKTDFIANEVSEPTEIETEEGPVAIAVSGTVMQPLGRAMALNVPLVIQFTASWCAPCQRFKKETLTNPDVKSLFDEEKAILLVIDTDEHPDVARQFGVRSLPEIVIMTPQGKSVERLTNFQDADSFLKTVQNAIKDIPNDVASTPRPLADLVDGEQNLRTQFNDDIGNVRMILILSPSWGPCVNGARVVQNEILAKIKSDKLKVYVVWTPVLDGDTRDAAMASTKNIHDPRAKHFWDGDQSLGKTYGQAVKLPNDGELAWDIYFAFDRDVEWKDELPIPADWMHQLGADERHLDGDKLHDSVNALFELQEQYK